jgi:hypothetical protein
MLGYIIRYFLTRILFKAFEDYTKQRKNNENQCEQKGMRIRKPHPYSNNPNNASGNSNSINNPYNASGNSNSISNPNDGSGNRTYVKNITNVNTAVTRHEEHSDAKHADANINLPITRTTEPNNPGSNNPGSER